MRWPWTKARNHDPDGPDIDLARRDLEALIAQRPDVDHLNDTLRQHRIANGFADKVFRLAPRGDAR